MDESSNQTNQGERNTLFEIRPYKLTELARIYHVNIQTFKKWIAELRGKLGQIVGHYLTIRQVEIVIAHLKLPYFVKVEVVPEEQLDPVLEEKMKRLPTLTKSNSVSQEKTNHKKTVIKRAKAIKRIRNKRK